MKAWAAGTPALPGMFAGGAYRTMTEVPSLSSNIPGVNVYPFMVAAAGLTIRRRWFRNTTQPVPST